MVAILTSVKWSLSVLLIFISLMASDAEHLFICLWALGISSLEKCLLRTFVHFYHWIFYLPRLELCVHSLHILEIKLLS